MIQFSVYGRLLNGNDALDKHLRRLADNLPPEGSVRCLSVTEKQYAGMKLLVGLPLFKKKGQIRPASSLLNQCFKKLNPRQLLAGAGLVRA